MRTVLRAVLAAVLAGVLPGFLVVASQLPSAPPERAGAPAAQGPVFRGGIDLVHIGATVTDRRGRLETTLDAGDFEVLEDGQRQQIRVFAAGDAETAPELHVGLLLDVSESMAEDLEFTRTAAIRFLKLLPEAVDMTVVDFDTEVRVARFGQRDFPRVVERIRQQRVRGRTALYDAVGVYLDGAAGLEGRKVMLLYSDGGDTGSAQSLADLLGLVRASDVTIYAIAALRNRSLTRQFQERLVLQRIAEASGGALFLPRSARDLDGIYEQVRQDIHAQYTIGYVSTNTRTDGTWRKVEIRVTRPGGAELRVRARPGYYALFREP
jgi:Ca-activated chloride channel family protein